MKGNAIIGQSGGPTVVINQSLVEELTPCGGIRIEDNVHVTAAGHENLTRPSIPW